MIWNKAGPEEEKQMIKLYSFVLLGNKWWWRVIVSFITGAGNKWDRSADSGLSVPPGAVMRLF